MNYFTYRIIESISFNYADNFWNLFSSDDDNCAIKLEYREKEEDFYSVETFPVEENGKVFRFSDCILCVNSEFTKGTVIAEKENTKGIYGCAMICLYGNLIRKNTLVMHGSLVDYNSNGIIFTGPSGAGKTTQAQLWEKYADSQVINGDMILLHKEDDGKFYAYGSPWHGSSDYCVNKKLPVKGIFVVKKSSDCSVSLLNSIQRLQGIFNEIMLPDWFDGCKNMGLDTLDDLLKEIPVYSFECTKNRQAVETIEKMLNL